MRHSFPSLITMAPSSPSVSHNKKPTSNPNPNCKHSPSATLDILILIIVLCSGAFLIISYLSYIFHSLSLILPPISFFETPFLYLLGFVVLVVLVIGFEICCGFKSNKCGKVGCKGLKKAREFDLQLQSEDCLRSKSRGMSEVDDLPWKGGTEKNPDYECLRAELRKMAPPNGRAVLLFRAKCGCPVAKLEGWGPKRGRRNKKSLALNGGGGGGGGDRR